MHKHIEKTKEARLRSEKGVTFFSDRFERNFFFVLTLVMLAWGLVEEALSG